MQYRTVIVAAALALLSSPAVHVRSDFVCRADASGNTSGSSADICGQVVRRWRLLTGGPPSPGEIHLVTHGAPNSTNSAGHWILEWPAPAQSTPTTQRSEERRVGKECRSGGAPKY